MLKKILFIIAAFVSFLTYYTTIFLQNKSQYLSTEDVIIEKNDSIFAISCKLSNANLTDDPRFLSHIIKFLQLLGLKINYGLYNFPDHSALKEVLWILHNAQQMNMKITIPEGRSLMQIKNIFQDSYLLGKFPSDIQEGDLLPGTYCYKYGATKQKICDMMKNDMNVVMQKAWNLRTNEDLKTIEELKILASIVEKEAKKRSEQKIIASVFLNRLKKRMKLQSCATVIYAMTRGLGLPDGQTKLLYRNLKLDSPFNTYKNEGLPPFPICSPGREVIFACAKPEESEFLFFKTKDNYSHEFRKSFKKK